MNMLKNLIKMDILKMCSLGIWAIAALVLMLLFAANAQSAPVGCIVFFYLVIYTPMAYDEQGKGNYLLCTLPVSRKQIVQAKYLYALLAIVLISLSTIAVSLFAGTVLQGHIQSSLPLLPILILCGVGYIAVMLPLLLCLGVTRSRFLVMLMYAVGIVLSTAYTGITRELGSSVHFLSPLQIIPIAAGILLISYLITVRLYEKRQFTE